MKTKKHMWTKDEIKKIARMWTDKTMQDIADDLGVEKIKIAALTTQMRKAGFNLPRKHRNGYLLSLLKEVKAEMR